MRLLLLEVKNTQQLLDKLKIKRNSAAAKGKESASITRDCRDAQQKLGHISFYYTKVILIILSS